MTSIPSPCCRSTPARSWSATATSTSTAGGTTPSPGPEPPPTRYDGASSSRSPPRRRCPASAGSCSPTSGSATAARCGCRTGSAPRRPGAAALRRRRPDLHGAGLNGVEVGAHTGGYLPFTCDVTDALRTGRQRAGRRRARPVRRRASTPRGKQRLHRGGIWYTAQSGIWQTVWVEAVPAVHVEAADPVPHLEEGCVEVTVHAAGRRAARCASAGSGRRCAAGGRRPGPAPRRAALEARGPAPARRRGAPGRRPRHVVRRDAVASPSGPTSTASPRLLLNGGRTSHVGVLDQGYWPDGLLTAPSDEAMVHDIATMKRLGFTVLRKHIKVEPLRWYAHCDRLGMLVWQDVVNGGGRYRTAAVTSPGRFPIRLATAGALGRPAAPTRPAGRCSARSCANRGAPAQRRVDRLLGAVQRGLGAVRRRRRRRPGRRPGPDPLVDHASGWHDQGGGDLRSLHVYVSRFRLPRRARPPGRRADRVRRPQPARAGSRVRRRGRLRLRPRGQPPRLAASFTRLHERLAVDVPAGLAATVYTQLSDVEDELNGLLTYDREVLKIDEDVVRAALALLRARPLARPHGPA